LLRQTPRGKSKLPSQEAVEAKPSCSKQYAIRHQAVVRSVSSARRVCEIEPDSFI
jgi:hypothetical protein